MGKKSCRVALDNGKAALTCDMMGYAGLRLPTARFWVGGGVSDSGQDTKMRTPGFQRSLSPFDDKLALAPLGCFCWLLLSKNRIEVGDFSPSVAGRGSAQREETRSRLPRFSASCA